MPKKSIKILEMVASEDQKMEERRIRSGGFHNNHCRAIWFFKLCTSMHLILKTIFLFFKMEEAEEWLGCRQKCAGAIRDELAQAGC